MPYRALARAPASALTVRCVALPWYELVRLAAVVALGTFVMVGASGDKLWTSALATAVFVALLAMRGIPVLTVVAESKDNHVVVRGCRWPGPDVLWSCAMREAASFEIERFTEKKRTYLRLALRTTDDRILPLTQDAYAGMAWLYGRPLARLNGWLNEARAATG